jgi:SecD/SecF fusion protein
MNIWVKSTGAAAIVTTLIFLAYNNRKKSFDRPSLFSARYVVRIGPDETTGGNRQGMQTTVAATIRKRFLSTGYSCDIKTGTGAVLDITARNIDDTALAAQLVSGNSEVEFREIYTLGEVPALLGAGKLIEKYLPAEKVKKAARPAQDDTTHSLSPLKELDSEQDYNDEPSPEASLIRFPSSYDNGSGRIIYPAYLAVVRTADSAVVNRILQDSELMGQLPHDARFYYGLAGMENDEKLLYLYAIRTRNRPSELQNSDIEYASAEFDETGRPRVMLQFRPAGSRKWARLTEANIGRPLAIILDGSVVFAPTVNGAIQGGKSTISGGFNLRETKALAAQLSGNRLPAAITITSREIVSQSRGIDGKQVLFILVVFLILAGLAFAVFNALTHK